MNSIGDRIRMRREEIGMTQDDLAIKLGYSGRSSINKIEMGRQDVPRKKIEAFAEALNTSADYLMWGTEEEKFQRRMMAYADKIAHTLGYDLGGDPAEGYIIVEHNGQSIETTMERWETYEKMLALYAENILGLLFKEGENEK